MNILIAQVTRMGDVIQTSPLIHGVREKYPDAHITLIVRRMGKVIGERHPDVDDVIVYQEDDMFLKLRARNSDQLLQAYEDTDALVQDLRARNFDIVYNITHSIASAMLLKLVDIPKAVGAHLSSDWQYVLRGSWTKYFFTSVFSREYNDLNLCDITRNFVADAPPCRELLLDVREEEKTFVGALLEEHGIVQDYFVLCFQLGASEENKRWSETRFAELAQLFVERKKAKIFLLGIEGEAHLGTRLEEHAPGLTIPLYGKTSIMQVAALLQRANLLVTNDTGTMHIAAAVGCPITLVSVGHVHYRETGPYGEGHCAIELRRKTVGQSDYVPGAEDETHLITAEQVYHAAELTLARDPEAPLRQLENVPALEGVDLYTTRFAPDGFLQFYPVMRRAMAHSDLVRIGYRTMWLDYLDKDHDKKAERKSLDLMLGHYSGPDPETFQGWGADLVKTFEALAAIAQRGTKSTEKLLDILKKKKGMARAKQHVSELMVLDEEARVFSEVHPAGRPLILMARFERDNLEGADPIILASTTLDIYRACYARAKLMGKKVKHIVEIWSAR